MTHRLAVTTLAMLAFLATGGTAAAIEGRAWGDIHVQTMDGANYEFQSAGEFFASRAATGDLEVQLRLESSGFSPNVSVATAVAIQIDSTSASLALGREPLLFVDGEPMELAEDFLELPDGGRIERSKRRYEIYWADGSLLTVNVRKRHMNVFLRPAESRKGTLTGLFGNFNGIAADDVEATLANFGTESDSDSRVRAGLTSLAQSLFAEDEDPRLLTQEESLFEYRPGQTTASFRRPPPSREATPAALPAHWRRRAQEACEQAGVTDPELLQACIVDVGYTRDESFAESAAEVQARDTTRWDDPVGGNAETGF